MLPLSSVLRLQAHQEELADGKFLGPHRCVPTPWELWHPGSVAGAGLLEQAVLDSAQWFQGWLGVQTGSCWVLTLGAPAGGLSGECPGEVAPGAGAAGLHPAGLHAWLQRLVAPHLAPCAQRSLES